MRRRCIVRDRRDGRGAAAVAVVYMHGAEIGGLRMCDDDEEGCGEGGPRQLGRRVKKRN